MKCYAFRHTPRYIRRLMNRRTKHLLNRNGWWSFRMIVDHVPRVIALGTQDEESAIAAAEVLRHTAQTERMRHRLGLPPVAAESMLAKLGLLRQRSEVAKIGDIIGDEGAFDEANRGRKIEKRSAANAKSSLRMIVRLVKGQAFDVEGANVSILTEQLLTDYEAERLRIRKEVEIPREIAELKAAGTPVKSEREFSDQKMDACQTTIKSTINQARSVFAEEVMQMAPYRVLKLPDLAGFMDKKIDGTTVKSYRRPQVDVLDRIRNEAPALKLEDAGAWLALQLEANGGLRRGSAADALWDWFVVSGPETVQLQCSRAKGNETDNAFPWDRYQEMLALKDSPTFVLPGKTREEREDCAIRLLPWLRARGLDRDKPNHELRKWAIDSRRTEHGLDEAQNFAGHSDQKLTAKGYSRGRTEKVLRVV